MCTTELKTLIHLSNTMPPSPTNSHNPNIVLLANGDNIQLAQAVYNVVTGKTEKLSRCYDQPIHMNMDALKQLHFKLSQMQNQWAILRATESITIFHVDDNTQIFSSYERFMIYDASQTSPVEGIVYELPMLFESASNQCLPAPYKVTVRAASRAALYKRISNEHAPPRREHWPFVDRSLSVMIEVEYVDYVVAHNIINVMDSWVKQIERPSGLEWIKHVQKWTHWIPRVSRAFATLFIGVTLFHVTPMFANTISGPQWLIFSATGFLLCISAAGWLGSLTERGIDSIGSFSFIDLNVGDPRLKEEHDRRNKLNIIKAVIALLGTIAVSVGSNLFTDLLKWFFRL